MQGTGALARTSLGLSYVSISAGRLITAEGQEFSGRAGAAPLVQAPGRPPGGARRRFSTARTSGLQPWRRTTRGQTPPAARPYASSKQNHVSLPPAMPLKPTTTIPRKTSPAASWALFMAVAGTGHSHLFAAAIPGAGPRPGATR
ncbi:MAG: hypothetical protein WKG07_26820 [Hymenobacter sp.]